MHTLLQPLRPVRNLTDEVVDRIATEIRNGKLAPGAQLPTEAELMAALGVSRTVIREAVAALRADGLVVTRQGRGAFVGSEAGRLAFRIAAASSKDTDQLAEILRVMELRLAVEVEAVALAAERASKAQLKQIRQALQAIDAAIRAGDAAIQEDFMFHASIAAATGNPHFPAFLAFLGGHVIPRQIMRNNRAPEGSRATYLAKIQRDHVAIAEALAARDPGAARKAMRSHLSQSIERYRKLLRSQADR